MCKLMASSCNFFFFFFNQSLTWGWQLVLLAGEWGTKTKEKKNYWVYKTRNALCCWQKTKLYKLQNKKCKERLID